MSLPYWMKIMSDKMVMHRVISVLSLLLLTFAPCLVRGQADEHTARKFCVDVLAQSKYDATQCLIKPSGYKIGGGMDPAALTYLCCLGLFNDVTHNYTPYMSKNLVMFVANVDSASNLLSLGTFVKRCKRRAPVLTRSDYSYWIRMGRTVRFCKAPWKK